MDRDESRLWYNESLLRGLRPEADLVIAGNVESEWLHGWNSRMAIRLELPNEWLVFISRIPPETSLSLAPGVRSSGIGR